MKMRLQIKIPGILLGVCILTFDNVPYGLILFDPQSSALIMRGAVMVLEAAILSQLMVGFFSEFPFAIASCIVENIPMLNMISRSIWNSLYLDADASPDNNPMYISTTLAAYWLSTVATSLTFFILGKRRWGFVSNYIPKDFLMGGIAGMGIYIFFSGVGVATGIRWSWDFSVIASQVLAMQQIIRIILVLLTEFTLDRLEKRFPSFLLLVPLYLLSVPLMVYLGMFISGSSLNTARSNGWLFDYTQYIQQRNSMGDYLQSFNVWQGFEFSAIQWWILFKQLRTIFAVVAFSIIHVPINVPALTLYTNHSVDVNHELKVHGLCNAMTSLSSLQSYMVYSTSALLSTTGVKYNASLVVIGLLSSVFIWIGPARTLCFFPTVAASLYLVHIALILMKDSIFYMGTDLDKIEKFVVWSMALLMQWDFSHGLLYGVVVHLLLFLLRQWKSVCLSENRKWVSDSFQYDNSLERCYSERDIGLMKSLVAQKTKYFVMSEYMFYGNAPQITSMIEEDYHSFKFGIIRYVIVDFANTKYIDCTGIRLLKELIRKLRIYSTILICLEMDPSIIKKLDPEALTRCGCNDAKSAIEDFTDDIDVEVSQTGMDDTDDILMIIDFNIPITLKNFSNVIPTRIFSKRSWGIRWCAQQFLGDQEVVREMQKSEGEDQQKNMAEVVTEASTGIFVNVLRSSKEGFYKKSLRSFVKEIAHDSGSQALDVFLGLFELRLYAPGELLWCKDTKISFLGYIVEGKVIVFTHSGSSPKRKKRSTASDDGLSYDTSDTLHIPELFICNVSDPGDDFRGVSDEFHDDKCQPSHDAEYNDGTTRPPYSQQKNLHERIRQPGVPHGIYGHRKKSLPRNRMNDKTSTVSRRFFNEQGVSKTHAQHHPLMCSSLIMPMDSPCKEALSAFEASHRKGSTEDARNWIKHQKTKVKKEIEKETDMLQMLRLYEYDHIVSVLTKYESFGELSSTFLDGQLHCNSAVCVEALKVWVLDIKKFDTFKTVANKLDNDASHACDLTMATQNLLFRFCTNSALGRFGSIKLNDEKLDGLCL